MKKHIVKALYIASVLLIIGFAIRACADWVQYNRTMNSAPFYVFVLARCVEFLPLSAAALIAALIIRKKQKGES